jgi:hypothetical protein
LAGIAVDNKRYFHDKYSGFTRAHDQTMTVSVPLYTTHSI